MDDKGRSAAWSPPPSAVSIAVSLFLVFYVLLFISIARSSRSPLFYFLCAYDCQKHCVATCSDGRLLCPLLCLPCSRYTLGSLHPPPTTFLLSALTFSTSGLTPALACAPSAEVAGCLALILASMMPFCSPCSSGTPSPDSLLRQLQHQLGRGPGGDPQRQRSPGDPFGPSGEEAAANDSEDSETF